MASDHKENLQPIPLTKLVLYGAAFIPGLACQPYMGTQDAPTGPGYLKTAMLALLLSHVGMIEDSPKNDVRGAVSIVVAGFTSGLFFRSTSEMLEAVQHLLAL
ncbi:MAG: hypothetical protein COB66_02660 [Coxiella sp. (in: Bacteria)]|nr:MAG: hypothetical protein COB66_02660 [Coxiella sp. (in: g-proteobacteria)]